MPLGLISSETIDDYWTRNVRRRIFYDYPNGTAPLVGLLSLMENEETPIPEFGWQEKRWEPLKTKTITAGGSGNTTGPFTQAGNNTPLGDTNGKFNLTAFTEVRLYVADASYLQVDHTIRIFKVGFTTGAGPAATGTVDVVARITEVQNTTAPHYVKIAPTQNYTGLLNTTASSIGKAVYVIGSAYAEGSKSRTGRIKFPVELVNYTQIFKTPFEMTRTALKAPLEYDKSGAYRDLAKENAIDHLAQIEYAAFFGVRAKTTAVDPDTGSTVSRRFTGGILWFLEQWEKGSVAAGGAFDFGQPDVSAETDWMTYTNKRIIKLGGNTITRAQFNELNSRVFEQTNASDWSKLCLCGPGYLNKVVDAYERQIQFTSLRENGFKGFDFELVKHNSNAGTVYYKQHPLFNDEQYRNSAFYIDLGYIGYRYLSDSDTDLQTMIQPPDADKRKDQWLTECGFEIRFPEAFMYVEDLGGITV